MSIRELRTFLAIAESGSFAAQQRKNSRGAHYRCDFPEPGHLDTSTFTVVRQWAGELEIEDQPVLFTRVKPGQTLLNETVAAE